MAGLGGSRMGLGRGCQPGLPARLGMKLWPPAACVSSGIGNERAGEGIGARMDKAGGSKDRQGWRNRWRKKSSTPPAKSTYEGQQAVNQARAPCHHLCDSLGKSWHRLFVCALKMENGEFIQFSSVIQCNDFHSLRMGGMLGALLARPCGCSSSGRTPLHMEVCEGKGCPLCKRTD